MQIYCSEILSKEPLFLHRTLNIRLSLSSSLFLLCSLSQLVALEFESCWCCFLGSFCPCFFVEFDMRNLYGQTKCKKNRVHSSMTFSDLWQKKWQSEHGTVYLSLDVLRYSGYRENQDVYSHSREKANEEKGRRVWTWWVGMCVAFGA